MGERAEDGLVGAAGKRGRHRSRVHGRRGSSRSVLQSRSATWSRRDTDEVIVTRRLSSEGRNRCYINGAAVTLGTMGELLSRLLSFAGQHEYRRLLDPGYQLGVLDEWAGQETTDISQTYRRAFLRGAGDRPGS